MRFLCCLCLLLPLITHAEPEESSRTKPACEVLCAELFAAVRANPAHLTMRLEDALVIDESCTGEIVTTAIDAVKADPSLVRKISKTAMDLLPSKKDVIMAAVKNYAAPVLVANPQPREEIRRPELPDVPRHRPLPGEEIRRAELPQVALRHPGAEVSVPQVPFNLMSVPKARPLK